MVIAVVLAWQKQRADRKKLTESPSPEIALDRSRWVFLLSFTLPLWLFYFVMNLWKRTEINWPAASYFTAMILLAGVFVEGWTAIDPRLRKPWRVWGTVAIVVGFLLTAAAMNTQRFYPWIASKLASKEGTPQYFSSPLHPLKWDAATLKLRGMRDRAAIVERVRQEMLKETGQEPLIITGRYYNSSSLSFYMPGHPFAYCIMSSVGGRKSQYDFWPGLNEKNADGTLKFAGRPAVILGGFEQSDVDNVIKKAFERVDGPEHVHTRVAGVALKDLEIYRAYAFRGLPEIDTNVW
jgi:hypothetical protein